MVPAAIATTTTPSSQRGLRLRGSSMAAGPGDFVHAPRGRAHSYRNVGAVQGELLTIYTPGGLEKLFLEIGELVTEGAAHRSPHPPDPTRLLERAPHYGLRFLLDD